MTRLICGVLLCMCATHTAVASAQDTTYTLDLTDVNRTVTVPSVVEGGGRGASGVTPTVWPLRLELKSTNQAGYAENDPISYEMVITNTGDAAVSIPTSSDRVLIEGAHAPYLQMTVGLSVMDGLGSEHQFGIVILDGVPGSGNSTLALLPSQSVFLKVGAMVTLPTGVARKSNGESDVSAFVKLSREDLRPTVMIRSFNSVEVELITN